MAFTLNCYWRAPGGHVRHIVTNLRFGDVAKGGEGGEGDGIARLDADAPWCVASVALLGILRSCGEGL